MNVTDSGLGNDRTENITLSIQYKKLLLNFKHPVALNKTVRK